MGATQVPQIRVLMHNRERIGMGFNSDSGLAVGTALEGFSVQADPDAPGQVVLSTITLINSHEELMDRIGMSLEAQGRYGFFSASVKAEFTESSTYNSTSTFLVAKVIVQNPFKRGADFRLKQSAKEVLDVPGTGIENFKRAFGDSFVRGLQTGGEFYAVIRITSISSTTQRELAASLEAEYNGLIAGGSFEARFNQANTSSSTRSEFNATMFQKAGTGDQIAPTTDISDVMARVKQFPTIVQENPVAYETEVATYDTLPLPIPTPEEQENFSFALRDARDKKLHYIQSKNDLEFARRNPVFFEELPSDEMLATAITAYTKLMNAVMDHGIKLSNGQMKPPRVFDPSILQPPLVEPAPILLKRAAPAVLPTIRVPNFIGVDQFEWEAAGRCLSAASVDDCLAGTAFPDQDGNPAPMGINREIAEFYKLCISGGPSIVDDFGPMLPGASLYIVRAQFPAAGEFVSRADQLILQWVSEAVT